MSILLIMLILKWKRKLPLKKSIIKFVPKISKFKRMRKDTLKKIQYKKTACKLNYGLFGIKLLKNGRLTVKQLELARQKISKYIKKKERMWIRTRANKPLTNKPQGIRMGKGKGDIKQWVACVKAGDILFELSLMSEKQAFAILIPILKKLPLPAKIVSNKFSSWWKLEHY